jgi:hypothetical protein
MEKNNASVPEADIAYPVWQSQGLFETGLFTLDVTAN